MPLFGETQEEILKSSNELKAKFEVDILNNALNIALNNGNNYSGFLNSIGEELNINSIGYISKSYNFTVSQIGQLQHVNLASGDNVINCKSIIATPCTITATNSTQNSTVVTLAKDVNISFTIPPNKTIVINSQNKTVTIDSENAFLNVANLIEFPVLAVGFQTITVEKIEGVSVKISYYPLSP